eukprot:scaffold41637_cov82-Cyclotella_meneghiniana.AAC.5
MWSDGDGKEGIIGVEDFSNDFVGASEGVDLEGCVECIITTSKPMQEKGTLQAPGSSEWSSRMDKSKGFSRGSDGTMLWVSHSTCVMDLIIFATGRTFWRTCITPSRMPLLAVVLWQSGHPRKWSP